MPPSLARHQTPAVRADNSSETRRLRTTCLCLGLRRHTSCTSSVQLCIYTITASAGDLGEFGPVRGRRGGVRGRVTLPGGGRHPGSDRDLGIDTVNNTLAFEMTTPARAHPLINMPVAMATDGGLSPAASTAAPSDLLNLDTSPQKRGRVDQPAVDALRDLFRGELQIAVGQLNDKVGRLEATMQAHRAEAGDTKSNWPPLVREWTLWKHGSQDSKKEEAPAANKRGHQP